MNIISQCTCMWNITDNLGTKPLAIDHTFDAEFHCITSLGPPLVFGIDTGVQLIQVKQIFPTLGLY
jgi:hypothetical protein